ncbi:hypothetical protein N7478_013299 [Penicillium angulare]|uniref:uncharacterized protein n=1 Tax=Penicillium angulare TaxID=116970 RepID=UPI0025413AB8|nr:uncharacterized protein N7478_013299 [Penicillium angulare]KAJ5257195.1 hypothetical protein N7478_013299 [Penicillium angulare]
MARGKEIYHLAPSEDDEESIQNEKLNDPNLRRRERWLKVHMTLISFAYLFLVVLYFISFMKPSQCPSSDPADSPIHWSVVNPFPSLNSARVLEYQPSTLPVTIHNNPYAGKPRPELEESWHDMFRHTNIRVHKEDLDYYNVSSLLMTNLHGNGGYYVAQMGVFHELHCLKRIRHWIYRSHYLANFTDEQLIEEEAHIDHCIELMRETILCRGDPTLSSFRWVNPNREGDPHLTVDAPGWHTCVNWEKLQVWNDEQAVDPFEPGALVGLDEL